jgi:hypothetical protein
LPSTPWRRFGSGGWHSRFAGSEGTDLTARATPLDDLLAAAAAGRLGPVAVVAGEMVLAEPAALRLARAAAERAGATPPESAIQVHRHPPRLGPLLADLRTFSLFAAAKVVVVVDSAALADRSAAADLVDQAAEALPLAPGEAGERERQAASRLLQALRLFGIDPDHGDPPAVIDGLPEWALAGGAAYRKGKSGRGRGKNQVEALREGLVELLAAARALGLSGFAPGDLADLGEVVAGNVPEGHLLILAERSADPGHPLVEALAARGAVARLGELSEERGGGWSGLAELAAELERQSGAGIEPAALEELARRTLKGSDDRGSRGADPDSASRFAGEYRKLATLAGGGRITRALVAESVEDRGEEDVWKLLDAIGEGRGGEALGRLGRMLGGAADPVAERLIFFSLLAGFCRTLTAAAGMIRLAGVRPGETNYHRFKDKIAPALQRKEIPGGGKNPLAGLHPYRLHRAYLAAGRLDPALAGRLPALVLDAELQLKGESGDPDSALAWLVAKLAGGGVGGAVGAGWRAG